MSSVIMVSATFSQRYSESLFAQCRYVEYRYAEYRYTEFRGTSKTNVCLKYTILPY